VYGYGSSFLEMKDEEIAFGLKLTCILVLILLTLRALEIPYGFWCYEMFC